MNQLYELCVTDDGVKSELSISPNFRDKVTVTATSVSEARQQAYKNFPMCDLYSTSPANNVPDNPIILGKYPNLWLDEKLTSCISIGLWIKARCQHPSCCHQDKTNTAK